MIDITQRMYGPRIYIRLLQYHEDWRHIHLLLADFNDFPLTEDKAKFYTEGWLTRMKECVWPYDENTRQQVTCLGFDINTHEPVAILRTHQHGTKSILILEAIAPLLRRHGYSREFSNMLAQSGYEYQGVEESEMEINRNADHTRKAMLTGVLSSRMSLDYDPKVLDTRVDTKQQWLDYCATPEGLADRVNCKFYPQWDES